MRTLVTYKKYAKNINVSLTKMASQNNEDLIYSTRLPPAVLLMTISSPGCDLTQERSCCC